MNDQDLAWHVEEACANAWPASRQMLLGGWLLRAAGGATRRTNSVNPLRGGPIDPAAIVADVEKVYAALEQPALFRVPDFLPEMDAPLARLGYTAEGESRTLFADLERPLPEPALPTRLWADADARWMAARLLWSKADAAAEQALRATLGAVMLPNIFAASVEGDAPSAVGFGVIDRGLLVVEAVLSDPARRRRGHGRALLLGLMHWATEEGATAAALQVEASNHAAGALYRELGFDRELYRYHYRRQPSDGG